MHLTALVEGCEHVCCRYRIVAFQPHLRAAGHVLEPRALPRGWWARLRLFRSLRGTGVVLQRKLLPAWQLAYLRRNARYLIFDFDDAVFLRDSYAKRGLHDARLRRRFAATVRSCEAVVAGNTFLRDRALEVAPDARVHVVPTCVETGHYAPRARTSQGEGLTLVWIGSSSTLRGLERAAPLLVAVGTRLPGVRLKLICDRTLALRSPPVVFSRWCEATEAAELASGDVGISWIPDDDWSRGKCGLKVLQYMAAGLPVVANRVGVQAEMVRHGETGFLAETADDWVEAVGRLATDPSLRARMGRAGRRVVEEHYGVPEGARRWRAILDAIQLRSAKSA